MLFLFPGPVGKAPHSYALVPRPLMLGARHREASVKRKVSWVLRPQEPTTPQPPPPPSSAGVSQDRATKPLRLCVACTGKEGGCWNLILKQLHRHPPPPHSPNSGQGQEVRYQVPGWRAWAGEGQDLNRTGGGRWVATSEPR